jgi:hypothetical protein
MRGAAVCLLLLACGGRANQGSEGTPPGAAGETGVAGADSSDASSGTRQTGGAPSTPQPTKEGGASPSVGGTALGAGGAADAPPLIEPGTRACQDYRDCLGLECIGKMGQVSSMCSVACASDHPCSAKERCVSGAGLEPSCFVRCDVGTECSYAFDCFDPDRNGAFVCVPAPWTAQW